MAPLKPSWAQPSHPSIQEVIFTSTSATEFSTKSVSRITVPAFGIYAPLDFPPCTRAVDGATYATVQCGEDEHLNLNSDLVYINHSCEPSLIFDLTSPSPVILAGPRGLHPGDELTFFYPSTEWTMAQPFSCFCGAATCRGLISGAKDMTDTQLAGAWLNGFIRTLRAEQAAKEAKSTPNSAHHQEAVLVQRLEQARKVVRGAEEKLASYQGKKGLERETEGRNGNGKAGDGGDGKGGALHGHGANGSNGNGNGRAGPTSRELGGEMGGDTEVRV